MIQPDEKFLQEEVQSDFLVSKKRKTLWAMELELVQEFQRICAQHNLKYYADGGTLIGAMRHGGFIPWDDDIDLMMMRDDYDKFIFYAKKELNDKYFLQTPDTDSGYYYGHAKIRMNGTTCIRYSEWAHEMPFHQGVFIDIFPLDAVPDNKFLKRIHRFIVKKFSSIARSAPYNLSLGDIKPRNVKPFRRYRKLLKFIKPIHFAHMRDKIAQIFDKQNTEELGELTQFYKEERFMVKRDWCQGGFDVPFEYIKIHVPDEYDNHLIRAYGDWKKFVKGCDSHGQLFFDWKRPYTDYISRYKEFSESKKFEL